MEALLLIMHLLIITFIILCISIKKNDFFTTLQILMLLSVVHHIDSTATVQYYTAFEVFYE